MTEKDAIYAKISNIKNCLNTIKKATDLKPEALNDQFTQDVFVLNLQRAVQAAIDLTNLVIAERGFELPRSYRHGFEILCNENYISLELRDKLIKMAGFRNIAVHDYTKLDVDILKSILKHNLTDLEEFYTAMYKKV